MLFRNKCILFIVLLTCIVLKVDSIRAESKLPSYDSLVRQSQPKLGSLQQEPLEKPFFNKDKFRPNTEIQHKSNGLFVLPNEIAKFVALSTMMLCFVFIFAVSRDTKDALIVTNCGAESIAFLKVYGVIPAAASFMVLYSYLVKLLSPQALFYSIVIPFMAFYSLFAFVLYPKREALHLMSISVPDGGISYVINLVRHWTFSLYYIVSEVWGSVGIPLLFWSCANDIFKIDQVLLIDALLYISFFDVTSILTLYICGTVGQATVSRDIFSGEPGPDHLRHHDDCGQSSGSKTVFE